MIKPFETYTGLGFFFFEKRLFKQQNFTFFSDLISLLFYTCGMIEIESALEVGKQIWKQKLF
ncbi:hypothetical protein D920_01242 [Enterococcus faecalis 13-SD-W-01]|nr:hypothetical protein D920_01242 [Enterococcus faecalis 13-SD-W-01]